MKRSSARKEKQRYHFHVYGKEREQASTYADCSDELDTK
jgi:hypothetical protein